MFPQVALTTTGNQIAIPVPEWSAPRFSLPRFRHIHEESWKWGLFEFPLSFHSLATVERRATERRERGLDISISVHHQFANLDTPAQPATKLHESFVIVPCFGDKHDMDRTAVCPDATVTLRLPIHLHGERFACWNGIFIEGPRGVAGDRHADPPVAHGKRKATRGGVNHLGTAVADVS